MVINDDKWQMQGKNGETGEVTDFSSSNIQYIEDENIINWNDGQITQVLGKRINLTHNCIYFSIKFQTNAINNLLQK